MLKISSILSLFILLFNGCLRIDSTSSLTGNQSSTDIQDQELTAGASSTTNWPPQLGGLPIFVATNLKERLDLVFLEPSNSSVGLLQLPIHLSGKIILFKDGGIPALNTPKVVSISFVKRDTVNIPFSSLDSLLEKRIDTLIFNLDIQTDSGHVWILGLGYDRPSHSFFKTPFSTETGNQAFLQKPDFNFKGTLDSSGGLSKSTLVGASTFYFYIPGTPYFWKQEADTLQLGPIPNGNYPLRLLRITTNSDGTQTEICLFEVHGQKIKSNDINYIFKIGGKILSRTIPGKVPSRQMVPW